MDDASRASVIALGVGVMALASAAAVALLRRTRGEPLNRRLGLMARLAGVAVWSVMPSRQVMASVAAGVLAFGGSLAVGLCLTILIIRAIPPDVPHPTEAYEALGDAVRALFLFGIGAMISVCGAVVVGFVVGGRVASRLEWQAEQVGTPDRRRT